VRPNEPQDVWEKIDKAGPVPAHKPELGPCWLWLGSKDADGYGIWRICGKQWRVARFIYEMEKAPIPNDFVLNYLCDNPTCVNPDHLEPVTCRENSLRGNSIQASNARKTDCKRGHSLSGDNLQPEALMRGVRLCVACSKLRARAHYERKSLERNFAQAI
jgi:hypothetical protein